MQIGLLKYQNNKTGSDLFNIGDYIQSISVLQFISGKKFILIDRERLDEYQGEDLKLVMNGWFMHCPEHWPPSRSIHPLFVAFHINSSVDSYLLSNRSISYFKEHEPVGCRDLRTTKILQDKGISAYFSGCMTLTLGYMKNYRTKKSDNIYFTDPYYRTIRNPFIYLKNLSRLIKNYKTLKILYTKICGARVEIRKSLKVLSFYILYSSIFTNDLLSRAIFLQHEIHSNDFNSEEDKFNYAEKLLHLYADAKLVVTSRIHCALPCLALETPVIYTDKNTENLTDNCRLDGLINFFNVIFIYHNRYKANFNFDGKRISLSTNLKNKGEYIQYRENLISRVKDFFNA